MARAVPPVAVASDGGGFPSQAQVLVMVQGSLASLSANMPGTIQAIPGDPHASRLTRTIGGGATLVAAIFGPIGVLAKESTPVGNLANLYQFALAILALVLSVDMPQAAFVKEIVIGQARFLNSPLGLAVLHGVLGTLTCAQAGVGYILAGLLSLVACALEVMVWHTRSMSAADDTGLIAGSYTPNHLQEDARNLDIIMQN